MRSTNPRRSIRRTWPPRLATPRYRPLWGPLPCVYSRSVWHVLLLMIPCAQHASSRPIPVAQAVASPMEQVQPVTTPAAGAKRKRSKPAASRTKQPSRSSSSASLGKAAAGADGTISRSNSLDGLQTAFDPKQVSPGTDVSSVGVCVCVCVPDCRQGSRGSSTTSPSLTRSRPRRCCGYHRNALAPC